MQQNLRDVFGSFGEISELHLKKDNENRSKGYAFIQFKLCECALLARLKLGKQIWI